MRITSRPPKRPSSAAAPAGLVSALALAAAGIDTLIIAPSPQEDFRTTAFLAGSVTALTTLGVWDACRPHAAPLTAIRIIDDTRRLWRAPEVHFTAAEIGLEAFGHNIENRYLIAALHDRAAKLNIPRISAPAVAVVPGSRRRHGEARRRRSARAAR